MYIIPTLLRKVQKTNIEKLIGFHWKYKKNIVSQYNEKISQYVFPISWHPCYLKLRCEMCITLCKTGVEISTGNGILRSMAMVLLLVQWTFWLVVLTYIALLQWASKLDMLISTLDLWILLRLKCNKMLLNTWVVVYFYSVVRETSTKLKYIM